MMIYCNACGLARGWPQDLMPAKGSCELCGQRKVCNHVQSSMLPLARA